MCASLNFVDLSYIKSYLIDKFKNNLSILDRYAKSNRGEGSF